MASRDTDIIGFSTADARQVLRMIEVGSREVPEHGRNRGGGGCRLFIARLNAAWVSNAADADIYDVDGATFTDSGLDKTVYDPLGIFSTLGVDDYLIVLRQAGKYYAIQAPCTG